MFVLDDEVIEHDAVDAKLVALRPPLPAPPAHERRPARPQRGVAGRAHVQPAPARAGARARGGSRRLRARLAHADRQGGGPGRRPSRRRLDGRGERRRGSRRRSRSDAAGHVGRADQRRSPRVRPPRQRRPAAYWPVRTWAIVVAAGGGTRFGAAKQFAQLGARARARPRRSASRSTPATAWSWCCPPARTGTVRPACRSRSAARRVRIRCVPGSRWCPADVDVVIVHDAARPLASRDAVRSGSGRPWPTGPTARCPRCRCPTR